MLKLIENRLYRKEKTLLKWLFIFGIFAFFYTTRKPRMKDWLIIFLLKANISTFLDTIIVKKGWVRYPIKLFQIFDISVLYDYILFPVSCVYYNQITFKSKVWSILYKVLYFSVPMTIVETWLERRTRLLKYNKGWDWKHTLFSLSTTFLGVRALIALIRREAYKVDNDDVGDYS